MFLVLLTAHTQYLIDLAINAFETFLSAFALFSFFRGQHAFLLFLDNLHFFNIKFISYLVLLLLSKYFISAVLDHKLADAKWHKIIDI